MTLIEWVWFSDAIGHSVIIYIFDWTVLSMDNIKIRDIVNHFFFGVYADVHRKIKKFVYEHIIWFHYVMAVVFFLSISIAIFYVSIFQPHTFHAW